MIVIALGTDEVINYVHGTSCRGVILKRVYWISGKSKSGYFTTNIPSSVAQVDE